MRRLTLILLILPALAHAQYSGSYLPRTGGTITGSVAATGTVSAINYNNLVMSGATAGNTPTLSTTGSNTNVSMNLNTQGSGGINLNSNTAVTGSLSTTADANITGNVNVKGTLSSTSNTQPASITNSGVAVGGGPNYGIVSIFDSTQSANNRTAQIVYFLGATQFRVASDNGATAPAWLTATGGQGSGVNSITSNSGTGSWSHTGNMAVSGALIAGSGTLNVYSANGTAVTTPHVVTGTVTLASGNGTATFTGNAVFSNTTSYVCTATNTSTNSAVRATNASASSVTFNSGTTNDVISYQCTGN